MMALIFHPCTIWILLHCLLSPKCCWSLTFPLRIERHSCITSLLSLPFPIPRSPPISCPLSMLTLWPKDWQFCVNASLFATRGVMKSEECKCWQRRKNQNDGSYCSSLLLPFSPSCSTGFLFHTSSPFDAKPSILYRLIWDPASYKLSFVTKYLKSVAKQIDTVGFERPPKNSNIERLTAPTWLASLKLFSCKSVFKYTCNTFWNTFLLKMDWCQIIYPVHETTNLFMLMPQLNHPPHTISKG